MKYFSHPSNARRAARKQLGKDAKEGVDYKLVNANPGTSGGQVGFEVIEKPKAKPAKAPRTLGKDRDSKGRDITAEVGAVMGLTDPPKRKPGSRLPGKGRRRPPAKNAKTLADAMKPREAGAWQGELIAMLSRPQGATAAEVGEAFGWLEHTSRARISVTPRAQNARAVRSREERGGKMVSVYRLETELPLGQKRDALGVRYDKQPRDRKPKAKAA